MNTLTKMALGLIGQLKPAPAQGYAVSTLPLPLPQTDRQGSLMQALQLRQSQRDFDPAPLDLQTGSNLLWAAGGVNRPELGGRTAPSAMNAQKAGYCRSPKPSTVTGTVPALRVAIRSKAWLAWAGA